MYSGRLSSATHNNDDDHHDHDHHRHNHHHLRHSSLLAAATRPPRASSSNSSSGGGDKYDRFEAWLRENGAQFEMLELREYDAPKESPLPTPTNNEEEEEKKEQVASITDTHPTNTTTTGTSTTSETESELRGVHARTHIPPHTVCMSIPRRCLITVEMGQDTPIGQAVLRSDLDLDAPKHIFLMIYLLWDRKMNGKHSFFHPYYQILPLTLSNMPIFWTREELGYLQGSYLLQQIEDRNEAIAEDYHVICQVAPLAQLCTLDEFKWARMCVCSRNFGLQIDGQRTSALVPHADMLNHYRPRETKWTFDEERQAFTITSLQPIPPGAQVYDSYGQKCNHRFLLNYGFAVEDNRELDGFCPNEVPLELSLRQDDALFVQKMEFWMRGEVSHNHNHLYHNHQHKHQHHLTSHTKLNNNTFTKRVRVSVSNNENTRLLFSLLRAMNCNAEELGAMTAPAAAANDMRSLFVPEHHRNALQNFYRSCRDIRHPLSLRNERAAMKNLLQLVHSALAQYPTSLAQDRTDLLDEGLYPRFSNRRHAKIQVRGEKEILHHYARWARTACEILDVIEQEVKHEQQRGVQLLVGRGVVVSDDTPSGMSSSLSSTSTAGYEYIIRRMEEEETGVHHTIVRYCADVLGSLRREELKNLQRQQPRSSSALSPASAVGGSPNPRRNGNRYA